MNRTIINVPMPVVRRLPKYKIYLAELLAKDKQRISSKDLAQLMGLTASQIRQDLNYFGGFGLQGYGYKIEDLLKAINNILGLNDHYSCVIVGAGNLGRAIANYHGFKQIGFKLKGMFDVDKRLVGKEIADVYVRHFDDLVEFLKHNKVDIGVVCVPNESSQKVANTLIEGGVNGIWNFSPFDLEVPEDIILENVSISESYFVLTYMLNEKNLEL